MKNRATIVALGVLLVALAASCSTFEQDWKASGPEPESYYTLTGRWEGRWTCDQTGHEGDLRCIVTHLRRNHYELRYWASWSVFESEYTMSMTVDWRRGAFEFTGAKDLGFWFGGLCRFEGRATPTEFVTSYESESNQGQFLMHRVGELEAGD